jgi:hypothetical protein
MHSTTDPGQTERGDNPINQTHNTTELLSIPKPILQTGQWSCNGGSHIFYTIRNCSATHGEHRTIQNYSTEPHHWIL